MNPLAFVLPAYLLGSLPFAVIVSRAFGLADPRSFGSKNPGATNVLRSGNKLAAALTLLGDAAKGWLAMWLAQQFGADALGVAAAGIAAFLGHVFPVFLRFKGGKGVATALGAALAFHWLMVLPSTALFIVLVALTRYVSLGSIVGSALMPVMLGLLPEPERALTLSGGSFALKLGLGSLLTWPTHETPVIALWSLLAGLVIAKHHENIRRLLAGTESPLWGPKKGEASNGEL